MYVLYIILLYVCMYMSICTEIEVLGNLWSFSSGLTRYKIVFGNLLFYAELCTSNFNKIGKETRCFQS